MLLSAGRCQTPPTGSDGRTDGRTDAGPSGAEASDCEGDPSADVRSDGGRDDPLNISWPVAVIDAVRGGVMEGGGERTHVVHKTTSGT